MPSRRTVAACATCGVCQTGLVERCHLDELGQFDPLDQQLRYPVTATDGDRLGGVEIDQRYLDFTAVTGVDGSWTVDYRKPHARSQSRSGMDQADHSLRNGNRDAGGHQGTPARRQLDIDGTVEINSGVAGMRTARQRQLAVQTHDR